MFISFPLMIILVNRLSYSSGIKDKQSKKKIICQIQEYIFRMLDKLCKKKEFWIEFMDRSKQLFRVCARPDLSIKCSKSKKHARAIHMKKCDNSKDDSPNTPTNLGARNSFERNKASKRQRNVSCARRKGTLQKMSKQIRKEKTVSDQLDIRNRTRYRFRRP